MKQSDFGARMQEHPTTEMHESQCRESMVYKLPRDCDKTIPPPQIPPLLSDCTSYSYNIQKVAWSELDMTSYNKVYVCA